MTAMEAPLVCETCSKPAVVMVTEGGTRRLYCVECRLSSVRDRRDTLARRIIREQLD